MPNEPDRGWPAFGRAVAAVVVTVVAVAAVYLFPYVTEDIRLPLGWDAAAYVARANEVSTDGLERFGAIRAAAPLLLTVLMRVTGENGFTLLAVAPPLFAAIAALGAGAMVRAALGIRAMWVPVIGFLAWAAFGENGMMNVHLDNLANSSLLLPGFAAVLAWFARGRGLVAATLLFMGAGLAHWPFLLFGMGVYTAALVAFAFPFTGEHGRPRSRGAVRAAAPIGASAAFVGLTFLWLPESGWVGARLDTLRDQLRERFIGRVRNPHRYYALPLAVAGAVVAGRSPVPASRPWSRRLFVCLMGSWILATVIGAIAQFAGIPTAGARLLHFLFPVPILAGVLVWWAARALARRPGRWLGLVGAGLVVALAVGGFGLLTIVRRSDDRAWIEPRGIRQVASTSPYIATLPADQTVVFVIHQADRGRPSWAVIKATLPGSEVDRIAPYYGSPADYLAGKPSGLRGDFLAGAAPPSTDPEDQVALVLGRYNGPGFKEQSALHPERVILPGVLVVRGPLPAQPVPTVRAPLANTGLRSLAGLSLLILTVLFAAGGGWAVALLPGDVVVRTALAPALGIASVTLAALGWALLGLSLQGAAPLVPLGLAAIGGWALAGWRLRGQSQGPTEITT